MLRASDVILAQKVEREAVGTPNDTLPGPVAAFDGARFELLEGETDIVPGVRIVPTPGHVPGHRLDREGRPHPEYAPWVACLQEFDPWRVTFAHDLAIWQREA